MLKCQEIVFHWRHYLRLWQNKNMSWRWVSRWDENGEDLTEIVSFSVKDVFLHFLTLDFLNPSLDCPNIPTFYGHLVYAKLLQLGLKIKLHYSKVVENRMYNWYIITLLENKKQKSISHWMHLHSSSTSKVTLSAFETFALFL